MSSGCYLMNLQERKGLTNDAEKGIEYKTHIVNFKMV